MTQPFLALSLGFGGVILATQIAFSDPLCDTRAMVTALLADSYGETRLAIGIAGDAAVMELFAAEATGTWSITLALPDGRMCLMASGTGFEALTESLPPPGDRT
jgi:hypothetical protein